MAEGFTRPPIEHSDGVYLDMPFSDYLADRALSGSAFKKLLVSPPDWWWEHRDNPLWREPVSDARDLGTAVHKAVLEGMAAYEAVYAAEPDRALFPDALDTARDMSAWIKRRNEELLASGEHDAKGKPLRLNVSGSKDDLAQRIRDHADAYGMDVTFWADLEAELIGGREVMRRHEDQTVRLVEGFLRRDPVYAKLLSDGLPEVSIFWTDGDIRYKARIDWLRPTAVIDLKTFGRPSPRGLIKGFLADRIDHGDDLQAVHAIRAVHRLADLDVIASGPAAQARIDHLRRLAIGAKVFVWLGVRVGGGPTALAARFDQGSLIWAAAEQKIAQAVAAYRDYRARFGMDVWVNSAGLVAPDIADWPFWATEVPA